MGFIQSGYRFSEREDYLDTKAEVRSGRSVGLNESGKADLSLVLARWEEWLARRTLRCRRRHRFGSLEYFEEEGSAALAIRKRLHGFCILADEAQDFSTLELRLLRRLVTDPDAENAIYLVGDLNQKIFPKHCVPKSAGFNFRGRVEVIRRNYRNTRQILKAACLLPARYPPPPEEFVSVTHPELSAHEGSRPLGIECTHSNHLEQDSVATGLDRRRGHVRVVVVSGNDSMLAKVRDRASKDGIKWFELFTVDDIDLWRRQATDPLIGALVISNQRRSRVSEFDTVIFCDLSARSSLALVHNKRNIRRRGGRGLQRDDAGQRRADNDLRQ